jgi:hypothetical protein
VGARLRCAWSSHTCSASLSVSRSAGSPPTVAWTLAHLSARDRVGRDEVAGALVMLRGEQLETQATGAG